MALSKITADSLGANAVTANAISNTAIIAAVGYTPANKAGDTFTGNVVFSANATVTGVATFSNTTSHTGAATFSNTVAIGGDYITPYTGFKNRIINGAMVIDQRNVGAAVASSTSAYAYMTDRFAVASSTDGGVSSQQVSDAPTGFTKSLKVTVTTADSSLAAAQRTVINHGLEGFNMADLNWGSGTAKPVTLSFWVKSSVTGTFSVSFRTGNAGTSYTAPYTINQANTWEYETITIPGATIGTWVTDNTCWAYLIFSLGIGSDYNTGTLNSWVSVSNGQGSTSHTSLMSTLNATWQVTGVQLEVGSTATAFDYRDYGRELIMCQRYYEKFGINQRQFWTTSGQMTTKPYSFKATKRAAPTITITNAYTYDGWTSYGVETHGGSITGGYDINNIVGISATSSGGGNTIAIIACQIEASAEL